MAKPQTRHYINELPKLTIKSIKNLINTNLVYSLTVGKIPIIIATKNDTIAVKLNNQNITKIELQKTSLTFGVRYWFACPYCHTRRGALYLTSRSIACRQCFKLHYHSQSESYLDRARRKIAVKRALLFKAYNAEYANLFNSVLSFQRPKGRRSIKFQGEQFKIASLEKRYFENFRLWLDKKTKTDKYNHIN